MATHDSVPMDRLVLGRAIDEVGGEPLPIDPKVPDHLSRLFDDCDAQLRRVRLVEQHDGQAARTALAAAGAPVDAEITYDPNHSHGKKFTQDRPFRTACLLHELMHVIVSRKYSRPAGAAGDARLINFHYAADGEVGHQARIVDSNFERLVTTVRQDRNLTGEQRGHVIDRLENYAMAQATVHNETVVLDLLVYLKLLRVSPGSATFAHLTRLSEEALERREEGGPGMHVRLVT
ncbi:hypothetical protein [Streptomyces zingiberis]|uniref:DUF4157 domain-containing protein n=1 Tax=Streptomyces zingiberis TaxID=2053010 RepID=A0ABX1C061_9ACTN|nr:hypothetical protein [Streptomyces zingiberis]NJQ00969.1 hypothetical protein [Streptomyces zingiberis]